MIMDVGRTSYLRRCRFFRHGPEGTIRWYRAPSGAVVFPTWHLFGSINWLADPWVQVGTVGEQYGESPRWDRGDTPPTAKGIAFAGPLASFQGGQVYDPAASYQRDPFGLLTSCTGLQSYGGAGELEGGRGDPGVEAGGGELEGGRGDPGVEAGGGELESGDGVFPASGGELESGEDYSFSLTGLELWLRADDLIGLGDGALVATWPDQSGSANDAMQPAVPNQGTLRLSIPGVAALVQFASGQWMQLVNTVGDNDGTWFAVCRGGGTPVSINTSFIIGGRTGPQWDSFDKVSRFHAQGVDFHRDGSAVGHFEAAPVPVNNLYVAMVSGTDLFLAFDTMIPSVPTATILPGPSAMDTVASQAGGVNALGLLVMEIMVYGRVLSQGESDSVCYYLASKWALSIH